MAQPIRIERIFREHIMPRAIAPERGRKDWIGGKGS